MDAYVKYLRSPASRPLTIAQYNVKFHQLLDEDDAFEHQCLQAWQAGTLLRRGNRAVSLTNAFPDAPPLKTASSLQLRPGEIRIEQHGEPVRAVKLTSQWRRELREFALGGAAPSGTAPCARKAVQGLLAQLDHKPGEIPIFRLPAQTHTSKP